MWPGAAAGGGGRYLDPAQAGRGAGPCAWRPHSAGWGGGGVQQLDQYHHVCRRQRRGLRTRPGHRLLQGLPGAGDGGGGGEHPGGAGHSHR